MLTANRSHIGRVRQVNEDCSWVGTLNSGLTLAVVADGMGGHQAGDVASQLAVEAVRNTLNRTAAKAELTAQEGKMLVRQAILEANAAVYETAANNERYHNMGTTIVAVLVCDGEAVIGHVGDSRVYVAAQKSISLLTADHSLVNELLKVGQLSAEEAANHPRRNVLTRAIGTDANVEVDIQSVKWLPERTLLLCSDGLTNMVSEMEMLDAIANEQLELDAKADHLIQLALDAGGDDNITVVLLRESAGMEREERVL